MVNDTGFLFTHSKNTRPYKVSFLNVTLKPVAGTHIYPHYKIKNCGIAFAHLDGYLFKP
jgi:hypothetical protein